MLRHFKHSFLSFVLAPMLLIITQLASATTTVTGNIQNLGTGSVSSGTFVRFFLRGCSGNQPRINGTAIIAPTLGNVYYFDMVPNGSGAISGTLYSTRDSTGLLAGQVECGGSFTSTWYGMVIFVNGKAGPETPIQAKNGATIDISNVTPISSNPVVTAPTGDSTYARLDAGNQPFTGAVTVPSINSVQWATGASDIASKLTSACNGTVPGILWVPLGSTTAVSPKSIPNNCTIKCPSPWGCKLTLANTSNATFFTQASGVASNITIEDMIIDGNQANQSGTSSCIYMQSVNGVHIRHNIIQNCLTHAIFIDGCTLYTGGGATCSTHVASQNIWVEDNLISAPINGHGVLLGNGPSPANTVVNNFHIRGNTILHTTSALVNGIFTLGAASVGTCGTGPGDITNNTINGATDTGIEVGQGSCQVTVTGNNISLGAVNGTTGIGIRSAQETTVVGNQVHGNGTNTTQICFLFWNNAGTDDLRFQSVLASGNLGKGCTAASSFDVQVNLGTAGARGVGDHFKMVGFETDGGSAVYNYLGNPTNFYRCGNDDGGNCTSSEGADFTFDPGTSQANHIIRNTGIAPTSSFAPSVLLHLQSGSGGGDFRLEQTANNNSTGTFLNTSERFDIGIRAASSNCAAESFMFRDVTGGVDTFCLGTSANPSVFANAVSATQYTSTIATGTAPLVVTSTTNVAKLNASILTGSGSAASLTGTGACATITTQTGGATVGRATCTGTTGASTLTITTGLTAPTGWVCYVQDQTTRANLFQQTSNNGTSCTLTVTSVTQNDVFVFTAMAF